MTQPPSPIHPPAPAVAVALDRAGLDAADAATIGPSFLAQVLDDPALGEALTRRALTGLAAWQAAMPVDGLTPIDEAELQAGLDSFARLAHGAQGAAPWTDAQHKGWQRARRALLDSTLAQPAVPLQGDCTLACFLGSATRTTVIGFDAPRLGPLTWDLASLLRDPRRPIDEAAELDHAIRYWDVLRRTGLPLGEVCGSDFGEFWRACEWTAMLQHLGRIGQALGGNGPAVPAEMAALMAWGMRVAMRYRPLQPLVSLIEPWTGARLASGFTF